MNTANSPSRQPTFTTILVTATRWDGCDENGRLVADRELVIPRGNRPVPLETIDAALDRVALAVVSLVEFRLPTAAGTEFWRLRTWSALSGMVQRIPQ